MEALHLRQSFAQINWNVEIEEFHSGAAAIDALLGNMIVQRATDLVMSRPPWNFAAERSAG